MHYTVYQIVNKTNGKVYIGKHQTKDLNDGYMGSGKLIKRSIDTYGVENFSKEILFIFESEELMNAKEKELVTEEFCLREDTYNICAGGQGGFSYINRAGLTNRPLSGKRGSNTLHTRRNIDPEFDMTYRSRLSKGYQNFYALGGRRKISKSTQLKGSINAQTQDAKQRRISSMHLRGQSKGEKNSQFGSMWITNGTENKKIKNVDIIPEGWYKGRAMLKRYDNS